MSRTCLVGESDPFIARLLHRFGEESGLRVVQARAGQELLDLARALRPEVLIVDAELPGAPRVWDVVQVVRADEALRRIPVIACTWLDESDARALLGDVAGHLQKPDLHYEDFVGVLRAAGVPIGRRLDFIEEVLSADTP